MDNKYIGVIGIIALLLGYGGSIVLNPVEQSNAYYCESSNTVGVFYGGISGTTLTAYPYKENRTKAVKCEGGWIKLEEVKTLPPPITQSSARTRCDMNGCTPIDNI